MKQARTSLLLSVVLLLGVGFIFGCSKKGEPTATPKESAKQEKAASPARPPPDTRLHAAIKAGDLDKIKGLLQEEFGKNLLYVEDPDGLKPIVVAAVAKADIEVFRFLLSLNPDQVRWTDKRGRSVANIAFEQGRDLELMKMLLANLDTMGDFTAESETGNTLLHLAAAKGNTELVRFLLEKKTSPRGKNRQGKTALELAQEGGQQETADLLIAHGGVPLVELIVQGDLEKFKAAIETNPANLKQADKNGKNIFHSAIESSKEGQAAPFLEFLFQKDASLLTKPYSEDYYTPLIVAALKGRPDALAFLLEKGVEVNSTNAQAQTALHLACDPPHLSAEKSLAVVMFLLDKGANLHAKDNWEGRPVHYAACSGNPPVVEYLLAKGADLEAQDKSGNTPLLKAASLGMRFGGKGALQVLQLLLDKGANFKAVNHKGQTALHLATDHLNADLARFFLEHGLDPNQADNEGNTPLHLLSQRRQMSGLEKEEMEWIANCRKVLLEKGANANVKNKKGETPLLAE